MIDERNIFEKGVLVSMHFGGPTIRKKMDKEQLKEQPTEIVRGVHDLFNKEYKDRLQTILTFDNDTRITIKNMTIPFPIEGIYFLKSEKIEQAIDFLEDAKKKKADMVREVVEQYDEAIANFANRYPDFYRKAKDRYSNKQEFASRFRLDYQLMKIAPPDKDSLLTSDAYKREMDKFRESVNEMKNGVLTTIASVLLEMTERLRTQCTDGKPSQRTLNSLGKFLAQIDDVYSDFIDRKDMKETIAKVKVAISGVDADSLRGSDNFKKEFRELISSAADSIKALPDLPTRRALEF